MCISTTLSHPNKISHYEHLSNNNFAVLFIKLCLAPVYSCTFFEQTQSIQSMNEDWEGPYVGDYELFEKHATGTFADVWVGRHRVTGCAVAVKRFRLTEEVYGSQLQDAIISMEREISIMSDLDHPLIADLYEVIRQDNEVFLVLEYVEGGTLLDFINHNRGPVDEATARFIFAQVVSVLQYLHNEKGIIHRDLKAENVLLDRYQNIRVIDFGFSNVCQPDNPLFYTACGSPAYVAPEMLIGQPYTQSADIWSAGVLLFAMIARYLPFEDANLARLVTKILHNEPSYPMTASRHLTDLLHKMMKKNPEERITLDGIQSHPWFGNDQFTSHVYRFDAVNKYRMIQGDCVVIDDEVMGKLVDFGVDVVGLPEMLKNHEKNSRTIAYRILFKDQITEAMAYLKEEMVVAPERTITTHSSFTLQKQIALRQIAESKALSPGKTQGHSSMPVINKIPSRGPNGMQLVNLIAPKVSARLNVRTRPLDGNVVVRKPHPLLPTGR